ncbi:hypothetical protein NYQ31_01885 [Curtobacterium flaccumfaciens]|jgi:hypothetical protein|uniref:hypothetical protein n=1 Tax=Curtobacterium flaccumfaciens TaxID=2035 RepID=UPI00217D8F94|nr:hypothetical protein [Curtobacterium flaccumfaciens]MCS6557143.1 hypothetical protein [Curtobacterium flaccumfaciens]
MRSQPLTEPRRPWYQERHIRAYGAAVVTALIGVTYLIGVQHPAFIGWLLLIVAVVAAIDGVLAQRRQHTQARTTRNDSVQAHH